MKNKCLFRGILKDGGIFACQKMTKRKQNQFSQRNDFNASVVYNTKLLDHFARKNYAWRLDIAQNFSCLNFWGHFVQNLYLKIFKTI